MRFVRSFLLLACLAGPLSAQGAVPLTPSRPKPLTYFFRSFALPGLGQAQLDRKLTGAIFIAVEGVALGMGMKAQHEIAYLERTGSGRLKEKRNERQDWFFLMAVNHLLSGMEAYVAASLYDFPADLRASIQPGGRPALGFSVPLGKRP